MTKNILEGLGGRLWLAPGAMLVRVFVFGTTLVAAGAGALKGDWLLVLGAALTYAIQNQVIWTGRRIFRLHAGKALLFPLVAVTVICCLMRSLFLITAKGAIS
jgi:hypothetical protein